MFCWALDCCADEFHDRLSEIETQRPDESSRAQKIRHYRSLIADNTEHPDVAEAMYRIANLWQNGTPGTEMEPNPELEMWWLQQTKKAANPNSDLWFDVRFRIAGRLDRKHPESAKNELQAILDHSNSSIIDARAHHQLQRLAIHHDDLEEAERICRMLQDWMSDQALHPSTTYAKGQFFEPIQASAATMMNAWAKGSGPKEIRRQKIDALRDDYIGRQYMQELHDHAIERLEKWD